MTRQLDIQQRKDRILAIVIDRYIRTIVPVGSQYITEEHDLDVSPATVRNILADLEEEGYLMHPHTSAGRMPTQQGYRYYVDHLMHEIQLLEEEKKKITQEYKRHVDQLEDLMEKTSQVVSDLTHYTSIVSVHDEKGHQLKIICKGTNYVPGYPDSLDILKIQAILRILEEKERLMAIINRDLEKKIEIYIGHEMALKDMDSCSLAISHFEKGSLKGRIAVLGPTRMQYDRVVSTLDYISQILNRLYRFIHEMMDKEKPKTEEEILSQDASRQEPQEIPVETPVAKQQTQEDAGYKDKYVRLLAEFDNMRKRHERERMELIKYAHEEVIIECLKLYDDLERSLSAFKSKEGMDANLVKGLEMVYNRMKELMDRYEVKPIVAVGKPFDPNTQEVLMQQETTEFPDGVVMEELEKGYTLGPRAVRTAKVKVAKNINS